jgi:hypothetical protein
MKAISFILSLSVTLCISGILNSPLMYTNIIPISQKRKQFVKDVVNVPPRVRDLG